MKRSENRKKTNQNDAHNIVSITYAAHCRFNTAPKIPPFDLCHCSTFLLPFFFRVQFTYIFEWKPNAINHIRYVTSIESMRCSTYEPRVLSCLKYRYKTNLPVFHWIVYTTDRKWFIWVILCVKKMTELKISHLDCIQIDKMYYANYFISLNLREFHRKGNDGIKLINNYLNVMKNWSHALMLSGSSWNEGCWIF